MFETYFPIVVLFVLVLVLAFVMVFLPRFLARKNPSVDKLSPYECGIEPSGDARKRFPVKFFLIAILFIIFDIEIVFLYPWAVVFKKLKVFGLIEMGVFVLILLIGYFYIVKKGALRWE